MDLYHDEYSVFYEYETSNDDTKDEILDRIKTEVIEVASDSEEESVKKVRKIEENDEFDEDFDDDDEANGSATVNGDENDCDLRIISDSVPSETLENNDGTYRCPLCPKEVVSKYNLKVSLTFFT